jgi:hypothetical protein
LALDGAELGVWSIDAKSGRFESDARDGIFMAIGPKPRPTPLLRRDITYIPTT